MQSDKQRVTAPQVSEADLQELVAGNTHFALDLYRQLRGEDGNIFCSPFSISIALAMTYAGARNETEQQMADALHFTLPQARLHAAFNALDLELASRAEPDPDTGAEGFRLGMVNRLWGQTGYVFLEDFLDVLAENYGAGLNLLDFFNAPEGSRVLINDWVADRTEGRIEDLIPSGAIIPETVLVLTNAIYFKAAWSQPFDEDYTRDAPFNVLDAGQVTVPMMKQVANLGYGAGDGYQAVELPYEGNELSMVIVMPDAGRFPELEDALDAVALDGILKSISTRELDLTVPRFRFEWGARSMASPLMALGMPIAFAPEADFSGMDGSQGLRIGDVLHQAFVAVDEEGTEAAAATAVVVIGTSAPVDEPVVVTIDRPFIFLIHDNATGTVLFLGRVVQPES